MGLFLPFRSWAGTIGAALLMSTLVNGYLFLRTNWGWEWYWDWSALFLFFAVLLILIGAQWTDPFVNFAIAGIVAVLWYVFIVLGWSF